MGLPVHIISHVQAVIFFLVQHAVLSAEHHADMPHLIIHAGTPRLMSVVRQVGTAAG